MDAEALIGRLLADRTGRVGPLPNPERFLALCESHGVSALILEKARDRGLQGEGWQGVLEGLNARRRQWLARNIHLLSRLREFQSALRRAGIPCIVLKGGSLLAVLYSDFGLRPLGDIDVLVRKEDVDRILEILRRDGWNVPSEAEVRFWRRTFYHLYVQTRDTFAAAFEIHWDLEKEARHAIQVEELWERSVVFQLEGDTLRRLSNEDLMLHLLLHLAHHYYNPRLIWVCDIRRLAGGASLDWSRILARAERWRLRLPVYYSLHYVEKIFPGTVPPEVLAAARVGWLRRGILKAASTSNPLFLTRPMERPLLRLPFSLYFIDRPWDIVRFVSRNLGPKLGQWGRARRIGRPVEPGSPP